MTDAEEGQDSGRATWLTSRHESSALATALPEDAPELLLDVEIGFKRKESGHKAKKGRKLRPHLQEVVLSTHLAAKIVTRYCAHAQRACNLLMLKCMLA